MAKADALVLLEDLSWGDMKRTIAELESRGMRVLHVFPPRVLIGWLPVWSEAIVAGHPKVLAYYRTPVERPKPGESLENAAVGIAAWNRLIAPPSGSAADHQPPGSPLVGDAFYPPISDHPLEGSGGTGASPAAQPTSSQTSEFLIGEVAVGIILPESTGSAENWSSDRQDTVIAEITAGCNWWATMGGSAARLTFYYDIRRSVPTRYEPIQMRDDEHSVWVADVLANLGYSSGDSFARNRAYINDLRNGFGSDWCFSIFVADSYNDPDGKFADGKYFAFAYLGGPRVVMTYDNGNYGISRMDTVTAHEIGHIFRAGDEYCEPDYACCDFDYYGYLHIYNGNCEDGNPSSVSCIMRNNANVLCTYTRHQLGWRDSDGDGIFDPVDTTISLTLNTSSTGPTFSFSGTVTDIPYPPPRLTPCTINSITDVEYRVDGGAWLKAVSADGVFDEPEEAYSFTVGPLAAGTHWVEVRAYNTVGNSATRSASVSVVSLGEALDIPGWAVTTGGNASWFGQTAVTHDGVDAAASGAITHNQESWMQTSVTGPGTLSFWWKVSSESGYDYLEFYIDGVLQSGRISGEVNWQQRIFSLGPGTHTLRWRYVKDTIGTAGQDRGWVDQVVFTISLPEALDVPGWVVTTGGGAPWSGQTTVTHDGMDAAASGTITHNQQSWMETTVTGGSTLSFWWKVSSEANYDYLRFYVDGALRASISGEVGWERRSFTIPSGQHVVRWEYAKDSSFSAGQDAAWVDEVVLQDTQPPAITACPSNRVIAADANCQAVVPNLLPEVAASDNFTPSNALVFAQSPPAGSLVGVGASLITFTVRDLAGNVASCAVEVRAVDTNPPQITLCPASRMLLVGADDRAVIPNLLPEVAAVDNCTPSNALLLAQSPTAGTLVGPGSYTVQITISDWAANTAICSVPVRVRRPSDPVELDLLAFTHVWRYYQASSAPPGNWTAPDYDDSSWSLGPGALGYPTDENLLGYATVRTVLERYQPGSSTLQITSYYFRTTFNYPSNVTRGTSLILSNLVDDGCVIYLNGGELARLGMPSGTPAYTTLASRADDTAEHGLEVVTVTPTNLVRGVNTLAVEVHQGSGTSSDAIWAMALKAFICSEPRILGCPPDLTVPVGSPISIQMTVSPGGCSPAYQWYKGVPGSATPISGQTNDRLYYANASATHAGSYFLVATNMVGTATSCVVSVQVVPDIYPPGLVSAIPQETGASNTILVTFTENLLWTTATNPANYSLTLLAGAPRMVVVSNAQHFQNTVMLRVGGSNWIWGSNYVLTVQGVCDTRTNCLVCCSNQVRVAFWKDLFPYEGPSKFYHTLWAREVVQRRYLFWDQLWTMPDYDDSDPNLWPAGWGGVYYYDLAPSAPACAGLGTDLGWHYPDVLTYYFRTRFVAPPNPGRATLQLNYLVDDGAVFYLNGVEIGRVNMPAGALQPDTPASAEMDPNCAGSITVTVTNLRSGTNVLAAEVHQVRNPARVDLYYGVKLRGLIQEPLNQPILKVTRVTSTGVPTNTVRTAFVQMSWDSTNCPGWYLYMAPDVRGPWMLVATTSPFRTIVTPRGARFFNLRQAQ